MQYNVLVSESALHFLKHKADGHYVKTTQYENARKVLLDKNVLVLTGHPGEGKTAMAANLALEGGAKRENCVKLECASDWKDVDWSLRCFTTVIIDDIFGGRSLDHELLKDWKSVLNDIELFAKEKDIKFIITSRQYITKEAREMLDNITMFSETSGYTVHLESSDLSSDEMKCILKGVLERSGTEENMKKFGIKLNECVEKTKGLYDRLSGRTSGTVFGFPECAVLFATGALMERHGSQFFGSPESHFKTYVEQLYKSGDEEQFYKFLSLVIIWSEKTQTIKKEDLQTPLNVSAHVRHIADCFEVKITHSFIETLKLSLDAYSKFLLLYINETGEYTFTHNVIGEMVGVVLGKHRPRECIQLCPRDFLMDRITVSKSDQDHLKVFIPPFLESVLFQRFVQIISRDGYKPEENYYRKIELDAEVLKHVAFERSSFANGFILHIINNKLAVKLFDEAVEYGWGDVYLVEFILKNNLFTLAEPIVRHIHQLIRNRKYVSVKAICFAMLRFPSLFETLFEFNRTDVNVGFSYPTIASQERSTLLIEAAGENLEYAVLFLLKNGAKVNARTVTTPLVKAATKGHSRILEILLQYGADINAKTDKSEKTPLYFAAWKGHIRIVEILLQHGADTNAKTSANETPLYVAAGEGHTRIVEILLQHGGSEINASSIMNETPLHVAATYGNDTVVEMLLQHGAEINASSNSNETPLHLAADRGYHTIAKILLQNGAEINARRRRNETPLHGAAWFGFYMVVEILLQHGADFNAKTRRNWTPLYVAAKNNFPTIVELLLQHGADINVRTDTNVTPLMIAKKNGHDMVEKVLQEHGIVGV